jgi:Peptidase family S51
VRTILLGPQRRPTLDAVVRALSSDGPFATVTAGWQEREADDGELSARLGSRDVNLHLRRRWLDVQDSDPEYAAGERQVQAVLTELQDIYLVRLDHALQAVYALQSHSGQDWLLADAVTQAVAAVRELDAAHLRRVNEVRGEFYQRLRPHDRPVIAEHRAAVAGLLAESAAVVIAGGDVRVLADVLHLFNVAAALRSEAPGWPVIAWSAGAMALADRIVLFHDRAPQGPGHPEVYGSGLSVLRDVVLLPHARARLLLDDTPRMAVFARRFEPARCVLLDQGARVEVGDDGRWPHGTRVLAGDGHVSMLEAA